MEEPDAGVAIDLPHHWDRAYTLSPQMEVEGRDWFERIFTGDLNSYHDLKLLDCSDDTRAVLALLVVSDGVRQWKAHTEHWRNPGRPMPDLDDATKNRTWGSALGTHLDLRDKAHPILLYGAGLLAERREESQLRGYVRHFERIMRGVEAAKMSGPQMETAARHCVGESWAGIDLEVGTFLRKTHELIRSLTGKGEPASIDEPVDRDDQPPKLPTKHAWRAYWRYCASGENQTQVAEEMAKELGRPVKQPRVSRWLTTVHAYLEAGGAAPEEFKNLRDPGPKPKQYSVDPARLDVGEPGDSGRRSPR